MGNSKSCCIFANGSTPRHYRDPEKKSAGKSNGHFRRSGSSGTGLGSGTGHLGGPDDVNGQVSTDPGQGINNIKNK